ncbi:MAG TPA: hypothetical protein VGN00_14275 [Puia sp.]|jgi:hypothetical protein
MQQAPPIVIVKIILEVVAATSTVVAPLVGGVLDYQPGRASQIKAELEKISDAIAQATRAGRYPLIALFQDIPEQMGSGYDVVVTIPKISIAMLTVQTDPVLKRYESTFPKLYIIYKEFLRQLTRHKNIVAGDPGAILHTKMDRPGDKPELTGFNDYLDAIELSNLQLTFRQVNKCKSLTKS